MGIFFEKSLVTFPKFVQKGSSLFQMVFHGFFPELRGSVALSAPSAMPALSRGRNHGQSQRQFHWMVGISPSSDSYWRAENSSSWWALRNKRVKLSDNRVKGPHRLTLIALLRVF